MKDRSGLRLVAWMLVLWSLLAGLALFPSAGCGRTVIQKGELRIEDTQVFRDRSIGGAEYVRDDKGNVTFRLHDAKGTSAPAVEALKAAADAVRAGRGGMSQ